MRRQKFSQHYLKRKLACFHQQLTKFTLCSSNVLKYIEALKYCGAMSDINQEEEVKLPHFNFMDSRIYSFIFTRLEIAHATRIPS